MEEIQQWGPLDPSIHKALASLDRRVNIVGKGRKLRSTRLSRASTGYVVMGIELVTLRSTRLSRASTSFTAQSTGNCHFDPQGSREPRPFDPREIVVVWDFDPQGSREPRQVTDAKNTDMERLRSTRLSRASTPRQRPAERDRRTSIHKALASLDDIKCAGMPQKCKLRSTRLSRASTHGEAELRQKQSTSIHKALASLDGKNAQLFLHLCHIYMLHIIHLLQIVYQVEISSRNLIVFSGQL